MVTCAQQAINGLNQREQMVPWKDIEREVLSSYVILAFFLVAIKNRQWKKLWKDQRTRRVSTFQCSAHLQWNLDRC